MQIRWRLAPTRFKIYFKLDAKSDWTPATDAFNKVNVKDKNGNLITSANTAEYNTIYFNKPVFCKKLRIMMNEPTKKGSFSIHKVNFYTKRNTGIFKAGQMQGDKGDFCWYVNTDKPREGSLLIVYSCIDAIIMGIGNEIFNMETNSQIKLQNTKLCVGYSSKTKEVMLRPCGKERSAFMISVNKDGSMSFVGDESNALFIDNKDKTGPNLLNDKTEIIASSELDKNEHKKENILIKGNHYWSSAVGQKDVTIQFLFGKIDCKDCPEKGEYESQKIDMITINWIHHQRNLEFSFGSLVIHGKVLELFQIIHLKLPKYL